MWYGRPAKAQTSLRICAVWSEPLLVAWILYEFQATDWTPFGVSKLKRRLHRLVWVYTFQNATLLETTFPRSIMSMTRKYHRKPVLGVSDKVRFKPACSATETSLKNESLLVASLDMVLYKTRITKALIRLRVYAGWSAPVLFANQVFSPRGPFLKIMNTIHI